VTTFVEDGVLRGIQNAAGVHICASEAEGFGHYIVEAMGTGALVVTTDAPPMNELVHPDRGILVGYAGTAPQGMGTNFFIDPGKCEQAIVRILEMDEPIRRSLGIRAREWFLENDRQFFTRLRECLAEVGSGRHDKREWPADNGVI
jgi:glycosyltransferase involved in cell wall biosynthesis